MEHSQGARYRCPVASDKTVKSLAALTCSAAVNPTPFNLIHINLYFLFSSASDGTQSLLNLVLAGQVLYHRAIFLTQDFDLLFLFFFVKSCYVTHSALKQSFF